MKIAANSCACVELGMAYGQKYLVGRSILLVGLHTDWLWAFPWTQLNPLIECALDCVVGDKDELLAVLDSIENSVAGSRKI
jgi:hypothetical protein